MQESEERRDDPTPGRDDTSAGRPSEQEASGGPAPAGDFRDRQRRRGRRGRGGVQRFGGAPRTPAPARDDEESSQARELAAYERRQQQQQRGRTWRGGGWVAGSRPANTSGPVPFRAPGTGGGFRSAPRPVGGGMRGGRRPGGASYTEQIRRVTAGPRAQAAPSHEAGEPIAGPHAVLEAIRAGRVVKRLFVSNERGTRTGAVNELIQEAQQRRLFVRFVDAMEIQRVSPIENHQGVVAIVEGKAGVELDELLLHLDALNQPALVLAIDSLQDPQNFGVLLRSGEGAGIDGVVIPKHRAVGLTPAVAKTSAGASEHLMIAEVANLRQAIDALKEKGIWVVGTDETGDLLYDEVDYRGATAIVIGGEGEGIRRLVLEGCDQVVRIPMEGQVASLNAAAAGTVILYEALRQRRRNVPPADTRTPPPPRPEAITPQEESMDGEELAEDDIVVDDRAPGEGDAMSSATGAEAGEGLSDADAAAEAVRDAGSADASDDGAEGPAAPEPPAGAPKPRATRAKKATTTKKTAAKTTTTKATTRRKKTDSEQAD